LVKKIFSFFIIVCEKFVIKKNEIKNSICHIYLFLLHLCNAQFWSTPPFRSTPKKNQEEEEKVIQIFINFGI
jgi:hypothetical protein